MEQRPTHTETIEALYDFMDRHEVVGETEFFSGRRVRGVPLGDTVRLVTSDREERVFVRRNPEFHDARSNVDAYIHEGKLWNQDYGEPLKRRGRAIIILTLSQLEDDMVMQPQNVRRTS